VHPRAPAAALRCAADSTRRRGGERGHLGAQGTHEPSSPKASAWRCRARRISTAKHGV